MSPDKFVIIKVEMPAPAPALANETALPARRRNGKPRRHGYGAVISGTCEPNARRFYAATTLDGKVIVWGNQALARAAMLTLMR